MSDVFISYSRLDKEFVGQLREALTTTGQDVWIDWEDIPPSQSWWTEIKKGIAKANNIVVVLSPNSMASPICHMEIQYARELQKRIIPVLHQDYERDVALERLGDRLNNPEQDTTRDIWGIRQSFDVYEANDSELKHINYFFFRPDDDFAARFDALLEVIRTDYAHKERHTMLELRAAEWQKRNQDASFLLLDTELAAAQEWLNASADKEPLPTDLHREYIVASEKRTRQLRNIRRASVVGSLVAVAAIIAAGAAAFVGVAANNSANAAQTLEAEAIVARDSAQAAQAAAEGTLEIVREQVVMAEATVTQAAVVEEVISGFANALLQQSESPAAQIAAMDNLVERFPDVPLAYEARGLVYAQQGDTQQAIADYDQALVLDDRDAIVYMNRGNAHFAQGNFDLALQDYGQALALDDSLALAYYNRANIYQQQGEITRSIEEYDLAIALDNTFANAYINRGRAYRQLGQPQQSIEDFTQALALSNASFLAYYNRGLAYHTISEYRLAIDDYTQAIALDNTHVEVHYNRGLAYNSTNELALAIADFDRTLALDENYVEAYYNRGLVYLRQDQFDVALDNFSQAIAIEPLPQYYEARALIYVILDESALALADFEQALALGRQLSDDIQTIYEALQAGSNEE